MQFRIYKYENGGGGGELHNAYEAATAAEALAPFAVSEGLDPEQIEAASDAEAFVLYPDHVEKQGAEHLLCADAVADDDD